MQMREYYIEGSNVSLISFSHPNILSFRNVQLLILKLVLEGTECNVMILPGNKSHIACEVTYETQVALAI